MGPVLDAGLFLHQLGAVQHLALALDAKLLDDVLGVAGLPRPELVAVEHFECIENPAAEAERSRAPA